MTYRTSGEDFGTIYDLILDPTGRENDEFRRVGVAEMTEEDRQADGRD